ncbi:E4 orf4 [Simian adenovirus 18]|uniref:E4 orf4 n=1 Tax=Simian adenovirus 18 TaxID=909210 RepID=H8PG15_9ADEN|nr:E4 orf4 [Simian adenovirus 18]AFD10581.1 E4 orf4 [Simian adenovirus 18]
MPLPSLPPPPVCRDQSACVHWLQVALTACLDIYRDVIRYEVHISLEAERLLCGLQEWLHYALRTERARVRNPRYAEVCWRRTRFLWAKYEAVRQALVYDATRQTVSTQIESLSAPPPYTTL